MESHDTLVLIAELAVAIAGFSSVVVALESRGVRDWHSTQRFNLRILLQVSALAIFFSLFPLILERAIPPPVSWRWALWVYGLVHVVDVSTFILRRPPQTTRTHRVTQIAGLLLAILSLIIAGVGSLQLAEIYYLTMLVWHLGVAAMGFALLLFAERTEGAV